jgi:hypothetical protein
MRPPKLPGQLPVSIRDPGLSFHSLFGSAELALGGDDHGGSGEHDGGAEDQESRRVRCGYDVEESWLIAPSKPAWKIATSSTLLNVTL